MRGGKRAWRFLGLALLFVPYLLYALFVVRGGQGPVDYQTFMEIGQRLLDGTEVYGVNSYYPMPYVMVFAFFSWLPQPVSILLWLFLPVLVALVVSGWSPYALAFAPTLGHFVGGQSAVFGLLGLWGYRRHSGPDDVAGGAWLGLLTMKPQLGLVPCAWALVQWWKAFRHQGRIPRQAWAFAVAVMLFYLPGFILIPDWPRRWLAYARPLFLRAMSGFVPRTLMFVLSPQTAFYWAVLAVTSVVLLLVVWFVNKRQLTCDLAVLWSFVVSPLVHDYDLIQLLPLLETPALQWAAVLLSIPGLLVILTAYGNDAAWYVFTVIAPGLLWVFLKGKLLG